MRPSGQFPYVRMRLLAALLTVLLPVAAAAQTVPALPVPATPAPEIRAQIKPVRQTILSASIAGVVQQLPFREGERFQKGKLLIGIDCDVQRAHRSKAAAELDAAQRVLSVSERLQKLNATSELEAEIARANVAKAQAELRVMQSTVEKCTTSAPFSGRVSELLINEHQFAKEGDRVMEVLDDSALEIELIVPSEWLTWLGVGTGFSLSLLETGRDYPCEVTRLAAKIDPVSQTVRVTGRIVGKADDLLPGMSGRASFPSQR